MMKLVAEKMTVSKINTVISCDIQKVWGIVTSVENYTWRSDLSKLEVLDETWFVEYTKNGYPTFFTVTCSEPFMCWEFDMENSNMRRALGRPLYWEKTGDRDRIYRVCNRKEI